MSVNGFTGDMEVIARLLAERGFRLSRGTYRATITELPTICVDRPDTPEWNGVWMPWDVNAKPGTGGTEAQAAFEIAVEAVRKWGETAHMYQKKTP